MTHSPTGKAKILALDRDGGAIEWEKEVEGAIYAPVSVSPGIVYAATVAGTMYALDADRRRPSCGRSPPRTRSAAAPPSSTAPSSGAGASRLFGTGSGKGGLIAFRPGGGPGSDAVPGDTVVGRDRRRPPLPHGLRQLPRPHRARAASAPPSSASRTASPSTSTSPWSTPAAAPRCRPSSNALTPDEIAAVVEYERTEL